MILDCTLRDGGYYVDWDFDDSTVKKYLAAVAIAKIDVIEIGFRFFPANKFLGAFGYSTDTYLKSLDLPVGVPIAVMINASEVIKYKEGIQSALNKLFSKKIESSVDIVRVAVRIKDVDSKCFEIVKVLRSLGYRVFVNLMQADNIEQDDLVKVSSFISSWDLVEVLYFADSFGTMDPEIVRNTIETIKEGWSGKLGIHAHDNKGLALSNTLMAMECGVEYLDSTLYGMGRGAGNVKTEYLLVEIMQRGLGEYFPDALFPLTVQEFGALYKEHGWGENIYYFLSAVYGIHPTYVQEMVSGELYDSEQILSAINFLKSSYVPFYSLEKMLNALNGLAGNKYGGWNAKGWANGNEILIIAPGPEASRHLVAIREYINKKRPIVLCLNVNESIPVDIITAYVACHETRILIEADSYDQLSIPIILPLDRVPSSIKQMFHNVQILDFGLSIDLESFEVHDNGCTLSDSLSLFYAISIATASNARRILIAGADGYKASDPRYQKVVDLFDKYSTLDASIPIRSITKTTYPITECSVYDPSL